MEDEYLTAILKKHEYDYLNKWIKYYPEADIIKIQFIEVWDEWRQRMLYMGKDRSETIRYELTLTKTMDTCRLLEAVENPLKHSLADS